MTRHDCKYSININISAAPQWVMGVTYRHCYRDMFCKNIVLRFAEKRFCTERHATFYLTKKSLHKRYFSVNFVILFGKSSVQNYSQATATAKVSAIKRIIFIFIIYQIFNKEVLQYLRKALSQLLFGNATPFLFIKYWPTYQVSVFSDATKWSPFSIS